MTNAPTTISSPTPKPMTYLAVARRIAARYAAYGVSGGEYQRLAYNARVAGTTIEALVAEARA